MSIIEQIKALKRERNAVILAHNYQLPEVQECADYVGDSLGLSMQAAKTDAAMIVFCGVYFMAETAKILSPWKTVITPDPKAGCPMADMITATQLVGLKKQHPGAKVLCYVNTSAEVKAECDVCCTSANAVTVVEKAFSKDDEIIFVPDKYLAGYVASKTGKKFILWEGYCPVHARILPEYVRRQKKAHPQAKVIVHPECTPEVIALADEALSTEGMCKYARVTDASEIIVGTETAMLHRLRKENPQKKFYPVTELALCSNMKLITLDKVVAALKEKKHEVTLPQGIVRRAEKSIKRMLDFKD